MSRCGAHLVLCFVVVSSIECPGVPWSYGDEATWGVGYPNCEGDAQSPVDLKATDAKPAAAKFLHYWIPFHARHHIRATVSRVPGGGSGGAEAVFTEEGLPLLVGSMFSHNVVLRRVVLKSPAEHTINGVVHPMERQLWFYPADVPPPACLHSEEAVVVSHLYAESSKPDPYLELLRPSLTRLRDQGASVVPDVPSVVPKDPLPSGSVVRAYTGSVPHPPCTQRVLWLVLERLGGVTRAQLGLLRSNSSRMTRPVRPLSGRRPLRYSVIPASSHSPFPELSVCGSRAWNTKACRSSGHECSAGSQGGAGLVPPLRCTAPGGSHRLQTSSPPPSLSRQSGVADEGLLQATLVLAAAEGLLLLFLALLLPAKMGCPLVMLFSLLSANYDIAYYCSEDEDPNKADDYDDDESIGKLQELTLPDALDND